MMNRLPAGWKNKLYEILLRCAPIPLIRQIPFSYSTYIKCHQPKRGDVVIDCGAHIGNCAILFSRLVKEEGLVIALEPFKSSFEILQKRLKRLKIKNVVAYNKGLWETDSELTLRIFSNSISNKIVDEMNVETSDEENIRIDCITLDTLINELGLKRVDLVKMDIEGAEIEALKGAPVTMNTLSPRFLIASYHMRDNEKTYIQVERMLAENGYTVHTVFPPHLTTYGFKKPLHNPPPTSD